MCAGQREKKERESFFEKEREQRKRIKQERRKEHRKRVGKGK